MAEEKRGGRDTVFASWAKQKRRIDQEGTKGDGGRDRNTCTSVTGCLHEH